MTHPAPLVSVIIPVYTDAAGLRSCLEALSAQSYPAARYEVLVIDNSSSDRPAAVAAGFPLARVVTETRPGSYAARNRGLSIATGDVLAFTDADCRPAPDWIEAGVAEFAAERATIIAGAIDVQPRGERPSAVELYEIVFGYRQRDAVDRMHSCMTANVITRRAVFDNTGPFAESLLAGGDLEWTRRALALGFSLAYSDRVRVTTSPRRTLRSLARRHARNRGDRREMARLRRAGAHWLSGERRWSRSRMEDLKRLLDYDGADLCTKLQVIPVAALVRLVLVAEGLRLAAGGRPLR